MSCEDVKKCAYFVCFCIALTSSESFPIWFQARMLRGVLRTVSENQMTKFQNFHIDLDSEMWKHLYLNGEAYHKSQLQLRRLCSNSNYTSIKNSLQITCRLRLLWIWPSNIQVCRNVLEKPDSLVAIWIWKKCLCDGVRWLLCVVCVFINWLLLVSITNPDPSKGP